MQRILLLAVMVLLVPNAVVAYVQAYSVAPVKQAWSGMADPDPDYGVSQVVTCCWDQLDSLSGGGYVDLFVGDYHDTTSFNLDIYEYPGGVNAIATSYGRHPRQPHSWLRFELTTVPGQTFTKGKLLEFRFTRSGADSINYFWQDDDPYGYGDIVVGGSPISGRDLCLRVYSTLNPIPATYWGMGQAA